MISRLLKSYPFIKFIVFHIIFILLTKNIPTTFGFSNETDQQALLALKDQIQEDPFGALRSWNNTVHFCTWKGVTCGRRHQRVTVIDLSSLKLVGSLSPRIGNLTFLREIYFQNNSLHGIIPQEIGRLFRLQRILLQNNSFEGEFPTNLSHCLDIRVLNMNRNNIGGKVPSELGSLSKILDLYISSNNFIGLIPPSLGNLSSLVALSIGGNNLVGNIPLELALLPKLEFFQLSLNNLSGIVPLPFFNISSIVIFSIASNQLLGELPSDFGSNLPKLQQFFIGSNKFSGPFPSSIANASGLAYFDISLNSFTGPLPMNLGSLSNLEWLNFVRNRLGANKPDDLSFLNSLVNCTNLKLLALTQNGFGGAFPSSIMNFSSRITTLRLDNNYISGRIPQEIGNVFVNLETLAFNENMLTGNIPDSIGKLSELQGLYLYTNNISGEIPSSIGNMTRLTVLSLQRNMLEGSIPISLGNCINLQEVDLQHNRLTGVIPRQIIGLSSLTVALHLNQNNLTGGLPVEVGKLVNLGQLDISENKLTGKVPSALGDCIVLEFLDMRGNHFNGTIPSSFQKLKGIQVLDLSHNNLSGKLPSFLGELTSIQYLNLSYNMFEGKVPTNGVLKNNSRFSIMGNMKLCGGIRALQLPDCPKKVSKRGSKHFPHRLIPLVIILPVVLLLACLAAILFRLKRTKQENTSISLLQDKYPRLSYAELLQATNGFSSTNLIGEGRYGSVYKGTLNSGEQVVAIKVLNVDLRGANKSFLAECESYRNIRHRNLTKIITACSSTDFKGNDFKAFVLEFMPKGSLDSWLHPSPSEQQNGKNLSLLQRLDIAINVASAVDYLHHHCETRIVHCDLKPSNILLDEEFCAHVSDFGLARFLLDTASVPQTSSIGIRGTVGYVPPEYGIGGEVSPEGDVYSYGILLLEMFTGKEPTNDMFMDSVDLHNYVSNALPDKVMEISDPQILLESEANSTCTQTDGKGNMLNKMEVCLASIFQVGISCSAEMPKERMDIRDVLKKLHVTRKLFLAVSDDREQRRNNIVS